MQRELIFLPVLLHCCLVLVIYFELARRRLKAFREKSVDPRKASLYKDAWPNTTVQVSNALTSQFELPVLFYVLSLMAWMTWSVHGWIVVVSFLFVFCRIGHAWVHVNSNYVPWRFGWFLGSVACVVVLIIWQAIQLIG